MMEDNSLFIDTNILVYANSENHSLKHASISKLKHYEQLGFQLWINRQVIREYLSVMSKLMLASGNYDEIKLVQDAVNFQNQFFVADENIISTQLLLQLVAKYKVIGKSIHDCAIVACIKQQGIKNLLTNNPSDFTRYNEGFNLLPLEKSNM